MLRNIKNLNKAKRGFTIIEVMIVLAIAGLIMVIVFLAIPQLQKSQRNTRRRDAANRIKTEIDNYSGNNNGTYPVAIAGSNAKNFNRAYTVAAGDAGFFFRYLGCDNTGVATPAKCTGNIDDPQTGFPLGTGADGKTDASLVYGADPATTPGDMAYQTSKVCSGETTAAGTARNYTLQVRLEGGAIYCLDNH